MLARDTLDPGMQILTASQGFPSLPPSYLMLIGNQQAPSAAMDRMVEAIRHGFADASE